VTLRVGVGITGFDAGALDFVREAERLGADSVWVPEFWAYDALTPIGYLAATTSTIRLATGIVQLGARTPAMLAMSAMTLQALSGGRFVLGVGTSGPQVMEGWHGVRFDRPVRRTRETIEIVRRVAAGSGWSTPARSTGCRCPTAPARPSARRCRRRTSPSTSRRSARRTWR
jgi:alkanesulfonate monooxygenase SsuD/methylene tetrahydromethanopterin reductase-like flavin-dependent oxidoreductase (luciferase family)